MEEYDYGYEETPSVNKSIKGYQIIIIVLAVILGALSYLYYSQMNTLKKEYAIERDTLSNRILGLMHDYEDLRTENDTISQNLMIEREKADSLLQSLNSERQLNRNKIREYEKQLGTLRAVMQNYVHQIDSLNTLNRHLITENREIRTQYTAERERAALAEERVEELSTKVRRGSVINAREIRMIAVTNNDREVSRANRAARLRVDFTLTGNELATPGDRTIFVRITGPDGYVLANPSGSVFPYEGNNLIYSASRDIDYQNNDLPVSITYGSSAIVSGTYKVAIYMDGYLIGNSDVALR